jgi:hypothetical protein
VQEHQIVGLASRYFYVSSESNLEQSLKHDSISQHYRSGKAGHVRFVMALKRSLGVVDSKVKVSQPNTCL